MIQLQRNNLETQFGMLFYPTVIWHVEEVQIVQVSMDLRAIVGYLAASARILL
jgi:hypothetical protein